jgi:hypothetical protein
MPKAILTAYIYHKGKGKKGGNNVGSLIMQYLDEEGYIKRGRGPRKEMNLVMDNCSRQNKNRYVLHLATLCVELRYYRRVNIIFLVAGHTKNAADQLFNLLKGLYRKKQVFDMDQLKDLLDNNQYVNCIKVEADEFYDLGKFEDSIYKQTPLSGHTKKYQLFFAEESEMGVLFGKASNGTAEVSHRMDLRKGYPDQRSKILHEYNLEQLEVLKAPGIKTIKQVELYSKWRKHVPEEYKSPLYNNPGEDILQSVKEDRKSRKEHAEQRRLLHEQANQSGKLAARKTTAVVNKTAPARRKKPPTESATEIQQNTKKAKKGGTSKGKKRAKTKK